MKLIATRLVPGLLALAALLFAAAAVVIAVTASVQWYSVLLFMVASALAALAIVVMLRRHNRGQAALLSEIRSLAATADAQSKRVNSAARAAGRVEKKLVDIGPTVDQLVERLDTLESGTLGPIRRKVESLNPGPAWSSDKWEGIAKRLAPGKTGIEQLTRAMVARDISALLSMHQLVRVKGEPLHHTSYVATPETLLALVALVSELPDGAVVVEAGSGLSTVWLALAAEQSARSLTIVSLEHDPEYAMATRDALARQRLGTGVVVKVRDAPLETITADGDEYRWYNQDSYRDLSRIDMLFVDGPPASTGPGARYPAVPLLAHALTNDAVVILDDTDRDDERQCLEQWLARSDGRGTLAVERELDRAMLLRYRLNAS